MQQNSWTFIVAILRSEIRARIGVPKVKPKKAEVKGTIRRQTVSNSVSCAVNEVWQ